MINLGALASLHMLAVGISLYKEFQNVYRTKGRKLYMLFLLVSPTLGQRFFWGWEICTDSNCQSKLYTREWSVNLIIKP